MPLAAGNNATPAASRVGHEALHGIDATRIGHWPHRDALFESVAELDGFGIIGKARQEFLVGVLLHVKAGGRNAHLAGVAVLERGDGVGGLLGIGVGKHDHRGMAAELHGGALHPLGGERGQVLADWDRTRK